MRASQFGPVHLFHKAPRIVRDPARSYVAINAYSDGTCVVLPGNFGALIDDAASRTISFVISPNTYHP
ncbi:hypothetical protein ABZT02_05005 [Streptomyces sp. NPDC005402]|uniref:hypothetical protein n=1 Tax=Streptomyces sp. NPDC005402 TaxID=3155338 RepID=UPI0033A9CBBA